MWRHAVNAYLRVDGVYTDYMVMGPLRAGGELVELGWCFDVGASATVRMGVSLTGSDARTAANLRAGTSLIQRSNLTAGDLEVPMVWMAVGVNEFAFVRLPMSVRIDTGGMYIVFGVKSPGPDLAIDALFWALEIGPYGHGNGGERNV